MEYYQFQQILLQDYEDKVILQLKKAIPDIPNELAKFIYDYSQGFYFIGKWVFGHPYL